MNVVAMVLAMSVLAGCANLGIHDPWPQERAARNLCEAMRSYRPYYPNQCGEWSGIVPVGYGDGSH